MYHCCLYGKGLQSSEIRFAKGYYCERCFNYYRHYIYRVDSEGVVV